LIEWFGLLKYKTGKGATMNGRMHFSGAMTALVTPMSPNGYVDIPSLILNLEFQFSQGIRGFVPAGTTGESSTLSVAEHENVIRTVALNDAAIGSYILAGCGSNCTREALDYVEWARQVQCSGVLLVDPYYNGPSSGEIASNYYLPIADEFPEMDIVPYVIPGRTGCKLLAEDLAWLAWRLPNVRGVKDATGNIEYMVRARFLAPHGFSIFSGDDSLAFEAMTTSDVGADGVISVISNICPGPVRWLCDAIKEKNIKRAVELQKALEPLFRMVTVTANRTFEILPGGTKEVTVQDKFRNPLPVKTMMNGLGIPAGHCRQPLGRMTAKGVFLVRQALIQVWAENPELLIPVQEFYGVDIGERLKNDSIWHNLCA